MHEFFSFNFPLHEYVFCTSPAPPPPISFLMVRPLVVSASQDAGGYAISRQNNLELHLGCHATVLPCLFVELSYIGMPVVRTDGRSVGRTVTR